MRIAAVICYVMSFIWALSAAVTIRVQLSWSQDPYEKVGIVLGAVLVPLIPLVIGLAFWKKAGRKAKRSTAAE